MDNESDIDNEDDKQDLHVPVMKDLNSGKVSKDSLNTLLVTLRPCIAQAKVHIIHQLTRQVAGLKKKKCANDKEKAKNERKIARFVEEISILKRSKKDVISRWLVVNNKSFADITKQETLTQKFNMKVRVFVRTGEHKAVKKVLDTFKSKFPDWEDEIPKVLRTLGKKRKKTDPNKQELGIKLEKCKDVSFKTNLEEVGSTTATTSGSHESEDKYLSESESEVIDHEDTDLESDDSEYDEGIVNTGEVDDQPSVDTSDNGCDSGDEELFVSSLKNALKKSTTIPTISPNISSKEERKETIEKKKGEVLVKVLDLNNTNLDSEVGHNVTEFRSTDTDQSLKKMSSFFKGGESESEDEKEDEGDEFSEDALQERQESIRTKFQKEGRTGAGLNGHVRSGRGEVIRGRGRGDWHEGNRGHFRGDLVRGKSRGAFHSRGNKSGVEREQSRSMKIPSRESSRVSEKPADDDNLHPSWVAKKRANNTIAKFEGKKIKFGDESVSSSDIKHANVQAVAKITQSTEQLHPSWAAKQSQKSSIQTFQGKKVVFED